MNEESPEVRKLAAIMFTDMVGYSAMAQKNESLAIRLLEEHRTLLRPLFPKYGGREIETAGDAFFVEFSSAVEAVRCAVEMQHSLHERNQQHPLDEQIRIRIGVHLGDVIQKGSHVLGDGVNIAARLEPLAPPEGICISEDVARQVQNKLDIPLSKLGQRNLKNIQFPMEIYTVNLPWQTQHAQHAPLPVSPTSVASAKQKMKSKRNLVWYAVAFGGAIIAVATYFIFPQREQQSVQQLVQNSTPAVRVETLRVKEPANIKPAEKKEKPDKTQPTSIPEAEKPFPSPPQKQPPPVAATPSPNFLEQADSVYAIALAKYKAGELDPAKIFCDEALTLYTSANSNANVGKVQRLAATILLYQDALSASKQLFDEAENILERSGEKEGAALASLGSARVLLEQKKLDEAESNLNQIVSKNPESNAAAGAYGLLAHLALVNGKNDEAQGHLRDADRRLARGKEAMVDMFIETAHARYDAASGKTAQEMKQKLQTAVARAGDVASELETKYIAAVIAAKYMKPDVQPQQRFQRNTRRGAMQATQQRFETVRSEAVAKGFTLIARKTSEVLQR